MCSLEDKLCDIDEMPEFYKRFIDDSFSIMPKFDTANSFLSTLNRLHPSLSFTMEIPEDKHLPFLGMVVMKVGNMLETKVHIKSRDTGLLLHYESHVEKHYKDGLV